jgi:hypothetical protein
MPLITTRFDRIAYYGTNICRDLSLQFIFRRRLRPILDKSRFYDAAYLSDRLNYYNKLASGVDLGTDTATVGTISMRNSFYYYDLKEHARYFPRALRLNYEFGDVTLIPKRPSVVKSRPIAGRNQNAVIMKLDKLRHFYFWPDPTPFAEKKPVAVWRGNVKLNPKRLALVRRWHGRPGFDIGHSGGRNPAENAEFRSPFLLPTEQAAFKYVVSVEGNDVATNLKWAMATNSLCLMPAPVYETWFMEGRLEAGRHYVEVRADFQDLEEKVRHYERHPDEALAIIENAQAYVREFLDLKREQLISLLVLYKYFVATGQLEPDGGLARLFNG